MLDRMPVDRRRTLTFVPVAPDVPPDDSTIVIVLDSTWTASGDLAGSGSVIGIRGIGGHLLAERDLISETSARLDAWATTSGIVDRLIVDGTSMWFYIRLSVWVWLQQRILWTILVDELVRGHQPARITCAPGTDDVVVAAANLIAARDGLEIDAPAPMPAAIPEPVELPPPTAAWPTRIARRLRGRLRRLLGGGSPAGSADVAARRRAMQERLDGLCREPGRLLVVLEHARQRVETADGARDLNPYLSPVVDALRGTPLDPIEIDLKARVDDETWWARLDAPDGARLLPGSVTAHAGAGEGDRPAAGSVDGAAWAATVQAVTTPLEVCGVDLGPALVERVAELAARWMPAKVRSIANIRAVLRRLRPAGILLADEYHRQDWLTAARAEGVSVAAIQHGMIYGGHNGYMHRDRPAALALPDRTYVFGAWERDLLLERSIYREDEVIVSGSPRLDLAERAPAVDAAALRAELGVRPGDRLVVLSGTYGPAYRRFHIPYALDLLLDRPWPGVHLVVKQHPGERDRGPYEALISGLAAARGFEPPPVTVVQHIDLYRLLHAADAHLGIHSTVLTEAVATGTLNLLADTLRSSDLLGYVDAGVAIPVRDGATFLAALDAAGSIAPESRAAFLARHFEAGSASARLRDDLLTWLAS